MSALPPKADVDRRHWHVRLVPTRDTIRLLAYSITSSARSRNEPRDCEAERLGGGQIDDEIELGA
jgi:hypothetical protein